MIAFVQAAPVFGAVESYALAVLEGLAARDETACLLYPDVPELQPFRRLEGGSVRLVPLDPALWSAPVPRLALALWRELRAQQPRLVHVVDTFPPALLAARLAGVRRVIVTHHTPELARHDNLAGRFLWMLGWLTRPEVVYTSESDRVTDARRLRTHVIPLGIDVARFASASPCIGEVRPLIGSVGRLAEQKGHRFLVEAAPLVVELRPDARFVIVGDGELRGELEELARSLGVAGKFLFTGAREDVPELLASFDVFALPSLYEGLCLAVLEAQAAGVPVVATPVGGVRETVLPGVTGVRCVPRDARSLADGILWVLEHPEEARGLAAEARRRVERYSVERMVVETIALYAPG